MTSHVVRYHGDRNVVFREFPGSQAEPLQERSRFVSDHGDALTSITRPANHAQCSAIVAGSCERAGIAVSQDGCAVGNQIGTKPAQRSIGIDVFLKDCERFCYELFF